MKPVYKFFVPFFVFILLTISVVGVAFARHSDDASGGAGEIEIVGVVEAITDSAWTIDGKVYQLTSATEIKGLIQPGARVKVHLYTGTNGALTAREIELAALGASTDDLSDDRSAGNSDDNRSDDNNEFFGTVEEITQTAWKIDGKVYRITAATEIKGLIQPGAQVKVHLYLDANGVPTIREVEPVGFSGTGDDSSGDDSSGDDSSSDDNSGDDSSSDDSSGDDNSGDDSSGDDNSGDDSDDSSSNGDDDNSDDNSNDDDDHDDDDYSDDDDDDDDHGDDDDDDDD